MDYGWCVIWTFSSEYTSAFARGSHISMSRSLGTIRAVVVMSGLADVQHTLRSQWFDIIHKRWVHSLRYRRYGMSSNPCSIGITWRALLQERRQDLQPLWEATWHTNTFRSVLWLWYVPWTPNERKKSVLWRIFVSFFEKRQVTHIFICPFEKCLVTHIFEICFLRFVNMSSVHVWEKTLWDI